MFKGLFQRSTVRPQRRRVRTFRPGLAESGAMLETRIALSAPGTVVAPVAIVSQAKAQPKAAGVSNWNTAESWSFVGGPWFSKVSMPIFGAIASAFGAKSFKVPTINSLDTWSVSDSGVTMTPGSGLKEKEASIGALKINFGSNGTPSLTMTSSDGSPPVTLQATSATRQSITFKGQAPMTSTENGVETNVGSVPVTMTLTKTSPKTFVFTFSIKQGGQGIPVMVYHAKRPIR